MTLKPSNDGQLGTRESDGKLDKRTISVRHHHGRTTPTRVTITSEFDWERDGRGGSHKVARPMVVFEYPDGRRVETWRDYVTVEQFGGMTPEQIREALNAPSS